MIGTALQFNGFLCAVEWMLIPFIIFWFIDVIWFMHLVEIALQNGAIFRIYVDV